MAFSTKKRLERWLRQQFFQGESPASLFIRHARAGSNKGTLVQEFKVESKVDTDSISTLADSLLECLDADAAGLGGLQRYVVESYCPADDGGERELKFKGRFACRIAGHDEEHDEDGGDQFDTEGPNNTGLMAQQMRHNEVLAKQLTQSSGAMLNTMARIIDRLSEQNETLMSQRFKALDTIEEALTKKHEREMEMMQLHASETRKEQMTEQVMLLAPSLVNSIAKKRLLPEKVNPEDEQMRKLAESLTPDQFQTIIKVLNPAQQIALVTWLKSKQGEDSQEQNNAPSNGT